MLAAIAAIQCIVILRAQGSPHGWKVDSRANSLELANVFESPDSVDFEFRNVGKKTISAYSVCFSRDLAFSSCHDSDWFEADAGGVTSGGTDRISIGRQEADEYRNKTLQISAVLFEDGTNEGLRTHIRFIELKHLGRALETSRISAILASFSGKTLNDSELEMLASRVGDAPEKSDPRVLDELRKTSIAGMVIPDDHSLSERLRGSLFAGARNARIDILRAIDDMRGKPLDSPDADAVTRGVYFSGLLRHYGALSSRMIDICRRAQGAEQK